MKKIISKASNLSYILIITISLIVIFLLAFSKFTTGKASIFGYKPFFIMSGSMEPTIHTHQLVLGQLTSSEEVEVGDIVSYTLYDETGLFHEEIIHRIIGLTDDGEYIFKGDANSKQDKLSVSKEQINFKNIMY